MKKTKQDKSTSVMTCEDIKRVRNFEDATNAYKDIFTDNGLNPEALVKLVINFIELCDDDQRSGITDSLCLQSLIFGSLNYYEAMGILEAVKDDYKSSWESANSNDEEYDTTD